MNINNFPMLASGIGLILALVLAQSGVLSGDSEPLLPPLTLLFMSEFGFVLTALGAWFGGRLWLRERSQFAVLLASIGCLVLTCAFLYLGLVLWDGVAPG